MDTNNSKIFKRFNRLTNKWCRAAYYLKCLLFKRYNRLHIKTLPVTWCNAVDQIPHAMFQILTNFIELEKPDEHIDWNGTTEHRQARDKMDELYNWWHNTYLKFDAWEDFDETKKSDPLFKDGQFNINDYEKEFFDKVNQEEEEMRQELTRRCKELIDIQYYLWT